MESSAPIVISVIIATRDTCTLVCAAIRSVVESADDLVKEIIVVDNGSVDDTATVLSRDFPTVKYLRSEENLGFARANNLGADAACGEFLLLLNSDARLQPDSLGTAVDWMRRHLDCGIVGGQLLNADGSRQNSIANFPTLATELLNKSLLRRLWPQKFPGKEHEFQKVEDVDTVLGAFMLVRKLLWDELAGLDERYFFFFEETDFCLRARRSRKRVVHLSDVRVWHGQGQTAMQIPVGVRIEYWRSRYAYFAKNHSRATRAILTAGLILRLLIDWVGAVFLTLVTLGLSARWPARVRICSALIGWHLRGQPVAGGLPR
jgi:GT2 family glycosyltransferase